MRSGQVWTALTDPRRLRRISFGLVFALVVGMAIIVATSDGPWGDFNVFWEVGWIVRDDPQLLLDASVQEARVEEWYDSAVAPFAYPPAVGFAMVPLTLLPVDSAYLVTMVVLAALAGSAALLVCDVLGVTDRTWRQVAVAGTIAFGPVVRSYVAGQNASVTLFALALGWWLRERGHPAWAGVALGLLWYKPQFAFPVLLLVVVGRWLVTAATMGVVGVGFHLVHVWLFGADWVSRWWAQVVMVREEAILAAEITKSVSLVQYVRAEAGVVVGLTTALVLGLAAAMLFVRQRDPGDRLAITCIALLVTAPHALSYEATLLVPVLGAVLVRSGRGMVVPVTVLWTVGVITLTTTPPLVTIGWVLVVSATWWWACDAGTGGTGRPLTAAER